MRRLLRAGDERRQSVNVTFARCIALLRAWLMRLVLLMRREGLGVARDEGLRLPGAIGRFGGAAEGRLVVIALIEAVVAGALRFAVRAGEVGIVLAKLLLRRGDHAIVVLGMLVVVLRRDRIARALCVARELNIFLSNVGWVPANLHVGAVRLVDTRHRIVTLAVIVATAHALVLTVSHDLPVANPFLMAALRRRAAPNHSVRASAAGRVRVLTRSNRS